MINEYLYTMEKIYIHFLSDFDAILKILNNDKLLISVNTSQSLSEIIDLEIESPENFSVNVYPVTKKHSQLFSYSVKFNFEFNQLNSKNDYVKIYKLPENHFIIKFLPLSIKKEEIEGDKVEIVDMEIKKLSFVNDLAGRAKVEVLKSKGKKLTKENEYFVYINENIQNETSPELILLAFFEAYIAKDYKVCFSYLSNNYNFSANLDKDGLNDFFGEIISCHLINYYDFPTVALIYRDKSAVFSAQIRDGKIEDIYELNKI